MCNKRVQIDAQSVSYPQDTLCTPFLFTSSDISGTCSDLQMDRQNTHGSGDQMFEPDCQLAAFGVIEDSPTGVLHTRE